MRFSRRYERFATALPRPSRPLPFHAPITIFRNKLHQPSANIWGDTHQHNISENPVFVGCGVRAVETNESNTYRRTQRKNTVLRSANQYSRTQPITCRKWRFSTLPLPPSLFPVLRSLFSDTYEHKFWHNCRQYMRNDEFFGVAINIYGHNDYKRTQQAVEGYERCTISVA